MAIAQNYVTVTRRNFNKNVNPLFNFWREKKRGGLLRTKHITHHLISAKLDLKIRVLWM